MDKELLTKARELEDRIDYLKKSLERLKIHAMPSSLLKIKVNQYYGDMGRRFTNDVEFKGDIADLLFEVIVTTLQTQIALLEKQLEAL